MHFLFYKIFNGYDKTSPEITLNSEFSTFFSNVNVLFITSIRGPFMIEWNSISRDSVKTNQTNNNNCNNNKTIVVGNIPITLNSPGYPNGYENNLQCSWIIKSEDITSHPAIEVLNIDLENDIECGTDFVGISKAIDMLNWEEMEKICKSEPNTVMKYEGNFLKIDFMTDYSVNGSGFSTIIKTKCGSDIKMSSGIINGTKFISDNLLFDCAWNITVRPGGKIKFKFTEINLYKENEKCLNYVLIHNGIDDESPLLGNRKYCGKSVQDIPLTSSNKAYVKWSRKAITTDSWILEFNEVRENCELETRSLGGGNDITTILTPNYPSSPKPFSECEWIITAYPGKRLRIQFDEKFDLTNSINCEEEYVEIRDGGTQFSKLIGKFCGSSVPNAIYTTNNIVRIKYLNDISSPKIGFKAVISVAKCGGTFYQQTGVITSPSYLNPVHLPSNTICEYRIERPIGTQINLTIVDLDLNCKSEHDQLLILSINDSNQSIEEERSELYNICDKMNILPFNISISNNKVLIQYKISKDSSVIRRGFKITYESNKGLCGKHIEAESGIIESPNYPNGINSKRKACMWHIKVPKGRRIKLKILDFDLGVLSIEKSSKVFSSRIILYNDLELLSKLTDITSNTSISEPIYSSDNVMTLYAVFYTRNGRGFKLEFDSEEATICVNRFFNFVKNGEFNLPSTNVKSYFCEYDISAGINETVTLNIEKFVVDKPDKAIVCVFRPSLSFQNSQDEMILTFCSNLTSFIFSSPLPDLKMRLIQSPYIQIKDIKIKYNFNSCGGILTVFKDFSLTEQNLGSNSNTHCAWQISAKSKDDHLFVSIKTDFEMDCDKEYISINRGILPNGPHLAKKKYCGESFINSSVLGGLYVQYHSQVRNPNSKFNLSLSYEESCGGYLTAPFPDIKLRQKYQDNIECIWYIRVLAGYLIELEFYDRFYIQSSANCTKDYLQIQDFYDDEKKVTRYCGREKPSNIISKGQLMKIIFRSDESIRGDGFSIRLKTTCGGIYKVKKEKNFLSSPNYPQNYDNYLNCNYTLIAPANEYINVHILDFDFESLHRCYYDNVTVCLGNAAWEESGYDKCDVYCEKNSLKEIRYRDRISIILKTGGRINHKGFLLSYELGDCGGKISEPKKINSPLHLTSGNYINDMNCVWNITAPINMKITIKFELFEMEYQSECEYDFVEIYSGIHATPNGRLARLCGNLTGKLSPLSINQNNGVIISRTDTSNSYRGFSAYINFVRECDQEIEISINRVYEFNMFSGSYENNLDCNFVFKTMAGYHIQANFTSFHVSECNGESFQNKFSCDFVELYDGQGPFAELIGRYTGHDLPPNITSTKSSLFLKFVTDSITTSTGFQLLLKPIETICGQTEYKVEENKVIIFKF